MNECHDPFFNSLTPEQQKIRQAKIEATADDANWIVFHAVDDSKAFEESSKVFE